MKRRPFEIAAAMAVILAPLPPLRASQEPADEAVKQADELFRSGEFAEAEKAYAAAFAKDTSSSRAVLRLGEIALLGNRFEKAERHLKRAIKLRPDDKRAQSMLAQCYYRQDKFRQAAPLLRAAGSEVKADKLASFEGLTPYEILGKADTTRVRFVRTDPIPIVKARINGGEEVLLEIDTGAAELVVDAELARSIGAPQFGSTEGYFAGGNKALRHHARIDSLRIGDFDIRNIPVVTRDMSRAPMAAQGIDVKGMIGMALFYHFIPTLDYPKGELVLRRRTEQALADLDRAVRRGRTHVIPAWMADDHILVAWGTVNGARCLMFADTGMLGGGFLCPESTIKAAGIDLSGLPSFKGMGGGGHVTVTPFLLKELVLGPAKQTNVSSFFGAFPAQFEFDRGFRIGGIISHAFFKPYALTFDFDRMQLYLSSGR
jgi:tetratricopeptide (TPR) repeat protein